MEIGDRVQTLNTFVPITGEIVDMYKNLVTIADDDAETVDDLLSFHADDLEVISWTTKRSLNATKVKPKNTQAPHLNLVSWMICIISYSETNSKAWAGVISSIKSRKTHTNTWAFQRYVRPIVPVNKLVHRNTQ